MNERCNELFLEEVKWAWESDHRINASDFPRLLVLAERCGSIERIEEENEWLRNRMDKMAGGQITPASTALNEAVV